MDWLDTQTELEKPLLLASGEVVKELVDDLLPQVRLAGLENEGQAEVKITLSFSFKEQGSKIDAKGYVVFPAKHAHTVAELEE